MNDASTLLRGALVARAVAGALALATGPAAVSDAVSEARQEFEARRLAALRRAVQKPFPKLGTQWGDLVYAIAALWLNESVDAANGMLTAMGPTAEGTPGKYEPMDHWRLQQAHRLLLLYGSHGQPLPGRLTASAERALLWHTWEFVKSHSKLVDADPKHTWWLVGSENHDIMYKTTYLFGALVLSREPEYARLTYDVGGTPAEHYRAWLKYFERYLDERARHGLFIEIASPTYQKYTLTGIYNLEQFATDERAAIVFHCGSQVSGGPSRPATSKVGGGLVLRSEAPLRRVVRSPRPTIEAEDATFAEFRRRVGSIMPRTDAAQITYAAGESGPVLAVNAEGSKLPTIDGEPIDSMPRRAFDTPFIQQEWGSGKLVIRKGERRLLLDFHR